MNENMRPENVPPPQLEPGERILSRELVGPSEDSDWWLVSLCIVGIGPEDCRYFRIYTLHFSKNNQKWHHDPTSGTCLSRDEYEKLRSFMDEHKS